MSETSTGDSAYTSDGIEFDDCPPVAVIGWPEPFQVLTEEEIVIIGTAWNPSTAPPEHQHVDYYKVCWSVANGTSGDSWVSIEPESLFTQPIGPDWGTLAPWNTTNIREQLGDGLYTLRLSVLDQARRAAARCP